MWESGVPEESMKPGPEAFLDVSLTLRCLHVHVYLHSLVFYQLSMLFMSPSSMLFSVSGL
jgi:hypothetical protein